MSRLFEPLVIRDVTVPNRAWVSPMCQYSSVDGLPNDWHLVHLGQFALGGAGLVFTEASAVVPEGRISPRDAGIWTDEQAAVWRRITAFLREHGAVPGIQLAHAGRKASTVPPWDGGGSLADADGGWRPVGPSPVAFTGLREPRELTGDEVAALPGVFAAAARRALDAGFEVVELHFAHGYLVHEFLSPLSNRRGDGYGGGFDGRTRLATEIAEAVRDAVGDAVPVFARLSATDWTPGGWDIDDSVRLAKLLGERGVDLIDTSSGGNVAAADIPLGPGYQVPLAERIRRDTGMRTGAVGLITEAVQAEEVLASGAADAVLLAREMLRNPRWPLYAARVLGDEVAWPSQYLRAR